MSSLWPRYWDEAVETISRDELHALQVGRVRRQLERCYATSSFYRDKLRQAGAEPGDIRWLEDFTRLPVVTKPELRQDQREHPPFGSAVVADRASWREVHPSTGTTGAPVNTVWSAADVETVSDFPARTLWRFGTRPVVRTFAEFSEEFRIEVEREKDGSRITACTVVAEWADDPVAGLEESLVGSLRGELGVSAAVRLEPYGSLERTAFKAKRIIERAANGGDGGAAHA